MRTATFLRGTDDEFLQALGVPYGHIVIEGCDQIEVITFTDARRVLREGVERRIIDSDTAGRLEREIAAAVVLADMGDIYALARQHPMPKDLGRVVQFDTACPATPKLAMAMSQGRVVNSTGEPLSGTITTLTQGFMACRRLAKLGLVRMFDICTLMREMTAANLAMNEAAYRERWEGLPPATRQEIEAELRAASVLATTQLFERLPLLARIFGAGNNE